MKNLEQKESPLDIDSIRAWVREVKQAESSQRLRILAEVSGPMTANADPATTMRIELFVLDIIDVVTAYYNLDIDKSALVQAVQSLRGYSELSKTLIVPEETTYQLIIKVREKLAASLYL